MAKFELKFLCNYDSDGKDFVKAELNNKCDDYKQDTILISLRMDGNDGFVFLDKSTAIKFAKTLRTEINKITESEVDNG